MVGGTISSRLASRVLAISIAGWAVLAHPAVCAGDTAALRRIIQQLSSEASEIARSNATLPDQPNIAQRTKELVSPIDVANVLTRKLDKDPFIDAYLRWQLTSFEPDIRNIDDESFLKLLASLPRLAENPQADDEYVRIMRLAERRKRMGDSDFEKLRSLYEDVTARSKRQDQLNQPAIRLREWMQKQFQDSAPYLLLLHIEHCAATIEGAWPTRTVKLRMTKSLTAAANDASVTAHHRKTIESYLNRLADRKREFVSEVTFLATTSVRITESTAQASKADVRRWIGRLRGETTK